MTRCAWCGKPATRFLAHLPTCGRAHVLGKQRRQRHLAFVQLADKPRQTTHSWQVINAQYVSTIGTVRWSSGWRRYTFHPDEATHYDAACLQEIAEFLDDQMEQRGKA